MTKEINKIYKLHIFIISILSIESLMTWAGLFSPFDLFLSVQCIHTIDN